RQSSGIFQVQSFLLATASQSCTEPRSVVSTATYRKSRESSSGLPSFTFPGTKGRKVRTTFPVAVARNWTDDVRQSKMASVALSAAKRVSPKLTSLDQSSLPENGSTSLRVVFSPAK